jgi:Kef-type K+ transport system membrane component KefB
LSAKLGLLVVSLVLVLLPWALWRVPAVRRVMPLAVAQILVGLALGPSGLGRVAPGWQAALFTPPVLAAVDGIGGLGVLLYVFVTGLHLDAAPLRRDAPRLAAAALGSVGVPLLFGAAAAGGMLHVAPAVLGPLGARAGFVAAVAICIAVTALPVLAAVLAEMALLRTRIGQTALVLAALNDAALWVMLAVLLPLAAAPGHGAAGLAGLAGAAAWFAALFAAARLLASRLRDAKGQALLAVGVGLALLSAAASEALGTGYLIGAFAAGAAMPGPCRAALLDRLEAVTATVLLPFFFMSTGLRALVAPDQAGFLGLFALATVAAVAGKLVGTAWPARRLGFSWAEGFALGAMMQTKGLMEVVVLAVLHDAGLIGGQAFSALVAMAVACTVLAAPAVRLCLRTAAVATVE